MQQIKFSTLRVTITKVSSAKCAASTTGVVGRWICEIKSEQSSRKNCSFGNTNPCNPRCKLQLFHLYLECSTLK